jgi:hypothetical protein
MFGLGGFPLIPWKPTVGCLAADMPAAGFGGVPCHKGVAVMFNKSHPFALPWLSRLFALAGIGAALSAAPAQAVSAVSIPALVTCQSVEATNGCLFTGNIAPNTVADTQSVYRQFALDNNIANPNITLNYLFKSDDAGFGGALTGTSTGGGWATPGFLVEYLAVKAANSFVLYKLDSPVSSGLWSTFDIPNNGNPKDVSHLAFFGSLETSGAPEPVSWALMLTGMGLVGYNMRRRRGLESIAA